MNYGHVWRAVYNQPLAVLPEKLEEIRAFLLLKTNGEDVPDEAVQDIRDRRREREESLLAEVASMGGSRRGDGSIQVGRTAIVPVFGVLAQRVSMIERASGGVSTEEIGATLSGLVADRQVRSIILAFDSPGGSVYGVDELAKRIQSYGGEKKIVGIADSLAASAAYWLLAQTAEVTVTPGGQVGSIGVIAAHTDISEAEKKLGMKTTLVTSSPFKAELAPEAPLSAEARDELQSKVDYYHGKFVAAVAKGRGKAENRVSKEFGQGRMKTAEAAVASGMADRIGTLEQVLRRLDSGSSAGARARVLGGSLDATLAGYRVRSLEIRDQSSN